MINIQHVRFGAITVVLLLATVMLIPSDMSQTFVFAQNSTSTLNSAPITPASEPSESEDESSSSNDDDNSDNSNEASDSSGSDGDDNNDSQEETSSSDDEDSESVDSTLSSDEEAEDEQTNPLLQQITNRVNGALSASGIPVR